ncbi:MAG: hypothetical protein CL678_12805 [Bdellovibrionaceae bacterium]|nr:hypothetical protein [Pseudobdellovibrionaceae bacterium]|tara:strand:- start:8557 stop:10086 length:1530 start_codon:yes stop_codon:yes gene_type:complete
MKNKLKFKFILFSILGVFFSKNAFSSFDLDRKHEFKTIGVLEPADNVDGLFNSYIKETVQKYFDNQSQFKVTDLSRENKILKESNLQYNKVVEDPKILKQVARAAEVETLIRTRILKEGPFYRFMVDWLLSPKMITISKTQFVMEDPKTGKPFSMEDLQTEFNSALSEMIKRVPFSGHVTGIDSRWVTVNLGKKDGIQIGDELVISTIEEVKVHPLLGEISDWRLKEVGRIEVVEVDDRISFCKILSQLSDEKITRFQKITKIFRRTAPPQQTKVENQQDETSVVETPVPLPEYGYVAGGVFLGSHRRQHSSSSSSATGGGFSWGGKVEGQLWIDKNFFAETTIGYHSFSLSSDSGTTSTEGTLFRWRVAAGYSYLLKDDFFGPKAFARLGYHGFNFTLPIDSTAAQGPVDFGGLFIGMGIDVPFRDRWEVILGFDLGLFNSVTETGFISGDSSGVSVITFNLSGLYHYTNRMAFKAGFDFVAQSADFDSTISLSHRIISFEGSVLFYF